METLIPNQQITLPQNVEFLKIIRLTF